MDLLSLRCFSSLADTLNFRRSAQQLNMTQPALSQRLKRLEDEVGFRLFERSRAHVALTDAGREFLQHAERLVNQAQAVEERARQIASGGAGHLRVGYTPVSFFSAVPEILRDFASARPNVSFSFEELLSGEVEAALAADQVDVGFLHPPVSTKGLRVRALRGETLVVALPTDNPLADKASIRLRDLSDEDLILPSRHVGPALYDRIVRLLRQSGVAPRIKQEVTTSIAVLGLVAAGHGVGLVIASLSCIARPGLCFRPISGPAPNLPFAVASQSSGTSALLDAFLEHTVHMAPPEGRAGA